MLQFQSELGINGEQLAGVASAHIMLTKRLAADCDALITQAKAFKDAAKLSVEQFVSLYKAHHFMKLQPECMRVLLEFQTKTEMEPAEFVSLCKKRDFVKKLLADESFLTNLLQIKERNGLHGENFANFCLEPAATKCFFGLRSFLALVRPCLFHQLLDGLLLGKSLRALHSLVLLVRH